MDSKRQQKISRLIQKDLGEIFQQNSVSMFHGAFITVTEVKVSPDLGMAKVYLSFLMVKDIPEMVEYINEHKNNVRQQLGNRMRHQLRVIPDLVFFYDDTQEVAAKVDKLFENLDIPPADEDEEEEEK